jgi:hypothetical protein
MATRAILLPGAAEFPSTNFPALTTIHSTERRLVLAYDASTSETASWTLVRPQGWTGTGTLVITYCMASATTGGVAFDVAIEKITPGTDTVDLDSATSYASVNAGNDGTVPGTAGYADTVSVTLTNDDSWANADLVRISIARDVADGADTATGDCQLLAAELRDTA